MGTILGWTTGSVIARFLIEDPVVNIKKRPIRGYGWMRIRVNQNYLLPYS